MSSPSPATPAALTYATCVMASLWLEWAEIMGSAGRQNHPCLTSGKGRQVLHRSVKVEPQPARTRALEVFSQQRSGQQNKKNQGCSLQEAAAVSRQQKRERQTETPHVSTHQSLCYWSFLSEKWQSSPGACLWEHRENFVSASWSFGRGGAALLLFLRHITHLQPSLF